MKKTLIIIVSIISVIILPELLTDSGWWIETPGYEIDQLLL